MVRHPRLLGPRSGVLSNERQGVIMLGQPAKTKERDLERHFHDVSVGVNRPTVPTSRSKFSGVDQPRLNRKLEASDRVRPMPTKQQPAPTRGFWVVPHFSCLARYAAPIITTSRITLATSNGTKYVVSSDSPNAATVAPLDAAA